MSLEEFQRCKGQLTSGSYSDALRAGKLDDVVSLVVLNAADEESEDGQFKWWEELDAHELKLAEEPFIRAMSRLPLGEETSGQCSFRWLCFLGFLVSRLPSFSCSNLGSRRSRAAQPI